MSTVHPSTHEAASVKANTRIRGLLLLALGLAAALVYANALRFGLFNDDPTGNLSWLDQRSLADIFVSASGYGFYRPLGFAIWKIMYFLFGSHNAVALHFLSLLFHALDVVGVWLIAQRLTKRETAAWAAAIIFALAPFSYEAVAYVAALFHPLLTFTLIAALLAYDRFRRVGQTRDALIVLLCLLAALFTHENGVVLVGLLLAWELLFVPSTPRRRALPLLDAAVVLLLAFLAVWSYMQQGLTTRSHGWPETLANLLPFLQCIATPFLGYVRLAAPAPGVLALLTALALALTGLAAWYAKLLRVYTFALLWLAAAAAPTALFLSNDYVRGSPRLFYLFYVGVALLWSLPFAAIARLVRRAPLSLAVQAILLTLIVAPPAAASQCEMALYGDATGLVRQVAALSSRAPAGQTPLFVNLPVYFAQSPAQSEGCLQRYPWVNSGAIVYPAYANLRDFNRLNGGSDRPVEAAVVTDFDAIWPPRFGQPAQPAGLRDLLAQHPSAYVFDDKTWSFFPLGQTWQLTGTTPTTFEARFGEELGLEDAQFTHTGRSVATVAEWRLLTAPRPLTAFVHVYDATGKLVAQHDALLGQSGGRILYAPFDLRRAQDRIEDRHAVDLPADLPPGRYSVALGVYDPTTTQRLPAQDAQGRPLPDDLLRLGEITLH